MNTNTDLFDCNLIRRADEMTAKGILSQLKELFVQFAVAIINDNNEDLPEDYNQRQYQLNAMVVASGSILPRISGHQAETEYRNAYIQAYAKEMKCDLDYAEEHYDYPNTMDWPEIAAPLAWIKRVGQIIGFNDALNAKAFYAYCEKESKKKELGECRSNTGMQEG